MRTNSATRPGGRVRILAAIGAAIVVSAIGGCETAGQGALSGGAVGALGGLAIGSLSGNAGKGAAIGAISGAVAGGVIGDQNRRAEERQQEMRSSGGNP